MKLQRTKVRLNNPLMIAASSACASRLLLACTLLCIIPASRAERADRDQPAQLEADRVMIDDARQISVFEGAVRLTQGTIALLGDKIVVTQSSGGLQHSTITGQLASFRQKREGFDEYIEGYAERIEYDSSNTMVNFFGQARVRRGQDEVRGDHITYNSKTELFRAHGVPGQDAAGADSGRVRVIIQPKNKDASPNTGGNP